VRALHQALHELPLKESSEFLALVGRARRELQDINSSKKGQTVEEFLHKWLSI